MSPQGRQEGLNDVISRILRYGVVLSTLVSPAGMGETFQVLVASKGVGAEEVANLSGLSFGRGPR